MSWLDSSTPDLHPAHTAGPSHPRDTPPRHSHSLMSRTIRALIRCEPYCRAPEPFKLAMEDDDDVFVYKPTVT
eukprot:2908210-Prymnesium_polylepis.2